MGKKPIKFLSLLLLAGGMSLTTTIGEVQADDGKIYPASSCRPKESYYQFAGGGISVGGVSNVSRDKVLTIYCPLIRDYMADDAGISQVYVWFHNPNNQKQIWCRVTTHLKHGKKLHSKMAQSSKGLINGAFSITYRKDAGVWTFYTLTCGLPNSPNVRDPVTIHSFKVIEYD